MRLIDADELAMSEICSYARVNAKIDDEVTKGLNDAVHMKIQELIADTPTKEDAVIVVRCKDCKYGRYDKRIDYWYCSFWIPSKATKEYDFCSYGRQKKTKNIF